MTVAHDITGMIAWQGPGVLQENEPHESGARSCFCWETVRRGYRASMGYGNGALDNDFETVTIKSTSNDQVQIATGVTASALAGQ